MGQTAKEQREIQRSVNGLPNGWSRAKLGDLCDTTSGGTPARKIEAYFKGTIPWVKSGELPDGPIIDIEEYITREAIENSSAKLFPQGTLLVALYGATVGKLGILTRQAATNQAVCAIFPRTDLNKKYLFWYLRFVRPDLIAKAIGGAQPNISQGILRSLEVAVAPAEQQAVIVAEIEKQFSRLDEAVASLKRTKDNLKRYKAAVLKTAVEGKLTEDWRKRHPDVEPASKLLERILTERRAKWSGRGKYKEPTRLDVRGLTGLPHEWVGARLETVTVDGPQNGLYLPQSQYGEGIPILRIDDFQDGWSRRFDELQKVRAQQAQVEAYSLNVDDLVINRVNSPSHLGKGVVIQPKNLPALFESNMMRLKLSEQILPVFIAYYLRSIDGRRRLTKNAKWAVNQASINQMDVGMTEIPLPPTKEQEQIVAEVDRRLSVIDELESTVQANLTRAERLWQSIGFYPVSTDR